MKEQLYFIAYDLNAPNHDYRPLYDKIQELGVCQHPLDSVWFVRSTRSAAEIGALLKPLLDQQDRYIVAPLNLRGRNLDGWMTLPFWEWLMLPENPQ